MMTDFTLKLEDACCRTPAFMMVQTLLLPTRIKDAGIGIRHSQGRILFYTSGSRNGLEAVGGGGYTYKIIKKESQIIKKGFATSQTQQKTKSDIIQQIRIQKIQLALEIRYQVQEKALEWVPGPRHAEKIENILVLAPLGLVTLV